MVYRWLSYHLFQYSSHPRIFLYGKCRRTDYGIALRYVLVGCGINSYHGIIFNRNSVHNNSPRR